MKGMRSSPGHQNVYKPYSEYWNPKEKFEIFRRNNLGLPGIDVDTSGNSKFVFVLGSSFIENNYSKPENMATSVFQNNLKKINKDYNVLNLGYVGFDPYDSFRRMIYFKNKYKPECVILVINACNSDSYKLVENPFNVDSNSFLIDNSLLTGINLLLRNHSSFIRLTATLFQNKNEEKTVEPRNENYGSYTINLDDLFICLKEYNKKCDNNFICVSIIGNSVINTRICEYCLNNDINFYSSSIMTSDNQISGDWHLNDKGNDLTGSLLFNSFIKQFNIKK